MPAAIQGRNGRSVDLEDVKFHQCVRLAEFDENRQIVFTPPDGDFELMSYRLSQLELTPPFWIDCQVEHHGASRVEFMVKIRSQFKQKVQAQTVEVSVPCPPDCQNPVTKQSAVRFLCSCMQVPCLIGLAGAHRAAQQCGLAHALIVSITANDVAVHEWQHLRICAAWLEPSYILVLCHDPSGAALSRVSAHLLPTRTKLHVQVCLTAVQGANAFCCSTRA
jgi:hypothetical protein